MQRNPHKPSHQTPIRDNNKTLTKIRSINVTRSLMNSRRGQYRREKCCLKSKLSCKLLLLSPVPCLRNIFHRDSHISSNFLITPKILNREVIELNPSYLIVLDMNRHPDLLTKNPGIKRKSYKVNCNNEPLLKKSRVTNQKMNMNTSYEERGESLPLKDWHSIPGSSQRNIIISPTKRVKNVPLTVTRNGLKIQNITEGKSQPCLDALASRYRNGPSCLREEHQTSRKFCQDTIQPSSILNKRNRLGRDSKLSYHSLPPCTKLKLTETGVSQLTCGLTPSPSLCPGKSQSCVDINDIFPPSLSMSITPSIPELLTLTERVGLKLKDKNSSASIPSTSLGGLKSPISLPSEWSHTPNSSNSLPPIFQEKRDFRKEQGEERNRHIKILPCGEKLVTTGIGERARRPRPNASVIMSVAGVEDPINDLNAPWQRHLNDTIAWGQRFRW
jgi:hypothetical protein